MNKTFVIVEWGESCPDEIFRAQLFSLFNEKLFFVYKLAFLWKLSRNRKSSFSAVQGLIYQQISRGLCNRIDEGDLDGVAVG